MRVVVQRVNRAQVTIDSETVGKIKRGSLLLIGLHEDDELDQVKKTADKIAEMRISEDEDGGTDLFLKGVNGEISGVSRFVLLANAKKGNRPGFVETVRSPEPKDLWENFNKELENRGFHVETGEFGTDMQVSLGNDGPSTIVLDI